jgi:hypothetical protein
MILNIEFPETNIHDDMSEQVRKGFFSRFIDLGEAVQK